VAAAVAGNTLEFYDFIIYAFFAAQIGRAFFPMGGETASLLASVATFGVGFFTRPLGGVLIGAFADKAGRKPALVLTIALITVGTVGIAATPAYEIIGIAAPVIVVLCRLIQGLALGGEVGPATALLLEAAPAHRRGLYTSWQLASQGIAVAIGGLLGVTVSALLTPAQLDAWGWRLPFLFGLLLVPVGVHIRRSLPETLPRRADASGARLVGTVLRHHRRLVLIGIVVMVAATVSTQVGTYMATYAVKTLKLPTVLGQASVLLAGLVTIVSALAAGLLCDRFGRKVVMIVPRAALLVLVVPLFGWLTHKPGGTALLVVGGVLAALTALSAAASLVAVPELLPIALRSTGISVMYAIGATLFGGTTPFVLTWLIAATQDGMAPAYYVAATSVASLAAMAMLPETRGVDVSR